MTSATLKKTPDLPSRLVNGILSIPPLANLAKFQARKMMIKRAEEIGVPWRARVQELQTYNWDEELAKVANLQLTYPEYYLRSFHAYDEGNLSWKAALEVEVAACAVHAKVWPGANAKGDAKLRHSYHQVLRQFPIQPQNILDIACSVGMSTFALQDVYPSAQITGLDLSPYFLAVANYNAQQQGAKMNWVHAPAEATGLSDASFDLVSSFLLFHELPRFAAEEIFAEVRRLLRPNGYFTIMDMNPQSEIYKKMPPYILTLLKSTEPYLDEYFMLDIEEALSAAGFKVLTIACNSPRHRTIVAQTQ